MLRAAGLDPDPVAFARRWGGWTIGCAAVGYQWMGVPGVVIAAIAVPVVAVGGVRRRIGARAARTDDAVPGFCESLAAAMRAGATLPLALREATAEAPLSDAVAASVARFDVGESMRDALDELAGVAGTEFARLVARALAIGQRSGGDVPRVLDVLAEIGRDRARLTREMRAATAQARMSAWVVAALPVAFLFLTGASSREQTRMIFGTAAGWALLGAGAVLESAGLLWMRRLTRR